MATLTLTPDEALELKGKPLGTTEWKEVTQEAVDLFARATGDGQWIHTDPERAAKESPFRKTIAHGYFTLALVPEFFRELLEVTGVRMVINFGANRVRWPAPVPIPSRVRMTASVNDIEHFENGFLLLLQATIEIENQKRPAMKAEVLYRYYL
jgi:acyl dehydratase